MIEVSHLTKKYGSHYAVQDLSFTLEKGKVYGLLGPNGAGKSTTMNMITGYIGPTSGEIRIDGHSMLEEAQEAKKQIGYLPEIPPLYPDMTVYEYLLSVAELKKIKSREKASAVEGAMAAVEITDMKSRLIRNLSKGYRQRTGIAQALIGNPKVIILDEPTVGLDPRQIQDIRELVKSLGTDHTVILSSHILSEISAVCDDVLIINKGKLIARQSAGDLDRMALGQRELELVAEGTKEKLKETLLSLPAVIKAEFLPAETPPQYRIRLSLQDSADIRREIFFALADASCPILEFYPVNRSLEEIFLELTGEETL